MEQWQEADTRADVEVTQATGDNGSKWLYRTAFGTEVVNVRAAPMQWNGDTRLLYDGETASLSEANCRMTRQFRNRWEPSDLGEQIGGLTGCVAAGGLWHGGPPEFYIYICAEGWKKNFG